MMSPEWLRKGHVSLVIVFTLVVCCYHVLSVSRLYFKYHTTTKLTIGYTESIRIPTVAVCITTNWTGTNLSHFFENYVRPDANVLHMGIIAPPRSAISSPNSSGEEKLSTKDLS